MRICDSHWTVLTASVAAAGLSSLITEDPAAAMRNQIDRLLTGITVDNFDPVVMAAQYIGRTMVGIAGPGALAIPRCPLCAINEDCGCPVTNCGDELGDRCVGLVVAMWKNIGNQVSS